MKPQERDAKCEKEKKHLNSRFFLIALLSIVAIAIVSCDKDEKPKEKELTLLCGSSFVKPMERLC